VFAGIERHASAAGRDPGFGAEAGYGLAAARRVGWDAGRLAMILAVLERAADWE